MAAIVVMAVLARLVNARIVSVRRKKLNLRYSMVTKAEIISIINKHGASKALRLGLLTEKEIRRALGSSKDRSSYQWESSKLRPSTDKKFIGHTEIA